ncbi:hypothetical protein BpHYR1_043823 [Brachionus plicatilis]|uniref:Uncharacterized protein n=1 Tax=Brachionus plicatilis TaxID=10195 RepID=A0A3M7RX32_BRAPC|nr:hypothetical protein BpHYR1_043823 [Brachionus plicatilis]
MKAHLIFSFPHQPLYHMEAPYECPMVDLNYFCFCISLTFFYTISPAIITLNLPNVVMSNVLRSHCIHCGGIFVLLNRDSVELEFVKKHYLTSLEINTDSNSE